MKPPAVVMNMFHTGLGIARSLSERGVPVIGLSADRSVYGNSTRCARIVYCPNSRTDPEALLPHLLKLGKEIGRGVLFPTRDDDVIFMDRFRKQLEPYFSMVIPDGLAVRACLNKWETHQWAQKAKVAAPRYWLVEEERDLERILGEVTFPCVVKPVSSYAWHRGGNWQLVGGCKVVCVYSQQELRERYTAIARADKTVLIEEAIAGNDEALMIAACYMDRNSNYVAGFNTQKLFQIPEGFGTGCIVQTTSCAELFEPTIRLLQEMRFTGIAEVEYKWDATTREYRLIEINARPWDQHRLGYACGVDLIYVAYCEHAGLAMPMVAGKASRVKWIEEDAFLWAAIELFRRRDPKLRSLFRGARGRRICAIWSATDPGPFIVYVLRGLVPRLAGAAARALYRAVGRIVGGKVPGEEDGRVYENRLEKRKSHS
jgi:predicted ATP-grasp superfamily ATP-dependent carboligase